MKRTLFLADRNVLIDQTMVNDFRPFGGVMPKLSARHGTIEMIDGTRTGLTTAIDTERQGNKSARTILASTMPSPSRRNGRSHSAIFSLSFFDLIVIDESHRGSAAEDTA